MNDVMKMSRKALTMGVVLSTILWSMMATVLVAPLKASAAGCTSGTLVKGSLAAVYYCGADGKRYVFPNEKTFKTWYSDFSSVLTITDADLASLQIGGNATYRPGVKMVKITTDPKVYAVAKGGVLRPVKDEATASALYGSTWNKMIDDVADSFFTNYTVGAEIASAAAYDKAAEMSGSQSINSDKNLGGATATSGLSVSKAADSPAAATIPSRAVGVNFLKFTVTNGTASAATVDGVTLHRMGAGAPGDFEAVYLYEGDKRLTTGRTVNTSTNEVSFNSLAWSVAAGASRSFWVAASMANAAAAGNVNAFEVTSLATGTAQASGLPVMGSNMTLAGAQVGDLTVALAGSLTNPKVGQMGTKVAEFQLSAGSQEDLEVKRITLFQGGNISRSNLTNLKLKAAGSEIASAAGVDEKDRVTFVLTSGSLLEKGNSRNYEVWADIGGGARSADTIRLYTEEDTDVWALGKTYGYGANTARGAYDNGTGCGTDASCTTVEGGQVTLNFNGPTGKDIATNAKDVEVFNFNISAQSNVEVRKVTLRLTATAGGADTSADANDLVDTTGPTANYTDIKVIDTATSAVLGPKELVANETGNNDLFQDIEFTDIFTMTAGQTKTFKVTMDVRNLAGLANDKIRVDLRPFGSSDLRNLDNSTYVASTDVVPSTAVAGNDMTVRAPALEVTAASTPVAQTYIKGSTNIELGAINLKAGDGADIKLTALTVSMYIDANITGELDLTQGQDDDTGEADKNVSDVLLSAKLMDGTTQVGDLKSPTTSTAPGNGGQLQFSSLNLSVLKGQTKTLKVVGSLSSSAATLPDRLRVSVNDTNGAGANGTGDVTAQDPEGNDVIETVSGGANFAQVDGNIMTVAGAGSLDVQVAPDDTESEAGLAVGGQTNLVLAKYRLTAQNEELKLTKVRLTVAAASVSGITSLTLWDGSTQVGGPVSVNTNGEADFSGVNFVIPKDSSKTLTAKANLSAVGPSGATSGLDVTVTMKDGFGATHFEARGTSSSTVITDHTTVGSNQDAVGRTKILRKSKPTVANAALPTTVLNDGDVVVSRFTVTADSAGQVSLKNLFWNVTKTTAIGITAPILREVGVGTNIAASNTLAAACAAAGGTGCTIRLTLTSELAVSAGTSKTYELHVTVGTSTGATSISSALVTDTAQVTGELEGGGTQIEDFDATPAATATYNFIWSDNSAIPHNDTSGNGAGDNSATALPNASNDWTNGLNVKILPNDTQTLTRSS